MGRELTHQTRCSRLGLLFSISPPGKVPLTMEATSHLSSGEILAQPYRRRVQFRIGCCMTECGRWGAKNLWRLHQCCIILWPQRTCSWNSGCWRISSHVTSENLEPELWALGDIFLYDITCIFWPSLPAMVILSATCHREGLSAPGNSWLLYHQGTLTLIFFPSKTPKVCALPPIFEILPVKSLKARNQTLAPPFPELRYLSLAYNKVTVCFSTYFLRDPDGRVGCQLLWPKGQSSKSLHYRYGGSGIPWAGEVEGSVG